jgi:hypothetical protein
MLLALFLQDNLSQEQIQKIAIAVMTIFPILFIIGVAVVLVPCWFICKKAGFSPWLSMLVLFPGIGQLILLYVLAFAEWKVAPVVSQGYAMQPPYPPQPPYQPKV